MTAVRARVRTAVAMTLGYALCPLLGRRPAAELFCLGVDYGRQYPQPEEAKDAEATRTAIFGPSIEL